MSRARLVVTAVLVEGRSKSKVARAYGMSRRWVGELVRRFEAEGEAGLQPRSRRPHTSPTQTPPEVEDEIVRLRKQLAAAGLDAGAETIVAHLQRAGIAPVPAVGTVWRILTRRGLVTPQPQKRPVPSPRSPGSRSTSPTSCGRPTPPTGSWTTPPTSRSATSSTTTPG